MKTFTDEARRPRPAGEIGPFGRFLLARLGGPFLAELLTAPETGWTERDESLISRMSAYSWTSNLEAVNISDARALVASLA